MNALSPSVVIGFRDWGADRVRRSAESILASFGDLECELIISDYGSADPEPARAVAQALGAKHVYTPGDPVWSRSRALNAGFAVATGSLFICTDADMLFSPESMRVIVETAAQLEHCALFLQCRDLPAWMDDQYFSDTPSVNWELLEREGRLRPRWGMGGMMAISAKGYEAIRGFDERLHTYGGEDLDFAQRARRAGYRTVWVEHPDVRMYHMYHPPSLHSAEQTMEGRAAVQANREILKTDRTYVRNVTAWQHAPTWTNPLVSVVIATRDRSELLVEAIRSVLVQSVQDFEVIVVDDGSTEDVAAALQLLADDRIRYFRQDQRGISAARNLGLDVSRGYFTAVLDDDDLMPPHRLEWQVDSITEGYVGSAGSFINFDDETGELHTIISKHPTIANASGNGGAPGHGTWLIRTDVMRALRYDESIPSGVDNNFFLRLLRSGYRIKHSGYPVLLRRRHAGQVTVTDAQSQGDAAKQALEFFRFGLTPTQLEELAEEAKQFSYPAVLHSALAEQIRPFLPDRIVKRDAWLHLASPPDELPPLDGQARIEWMSRDGVYVHCRLMVLEASYQDLVRLRTLGNDMHARISAADGTASLSWVLHALSDYTAGIESSTPFLIRRHHSTEHPDAGAVTYSIGVDENIEKIAVSPINQLREADDAWLLVGVSAEEYFA